MKNRLKKIISVGAMCMMILGTFAWGNCSGDLDCNNGSMPLDDTGTSFYVGQ